jgi:hypothetical protein
MVIQMIIIAQKLLIFSGNQSPHTVPDTRTTSPETCKNAFGLKNPRGTTFARNFGPAYARGHT